jgi:uncharacterized membrane protein YedE/YeeE
MNWLLQPWPWWLSGILIGLTVPLLYILSGKAFGISTSLRHMGAIWCTECEVDYLKKHNWRGGIWNLVFIGGIAIGSQMAVNFLSSTPIEFLPASYYSIGGAVQLLLGGVLIGFGARYAGGCTSGHAITGISNLNWPSLVATVFFFVGGLIATWGPFIIF